MSNLAMATLASTGTAATQKECRQSCYRSNMYGMSSMVAVARASHSGLGCGKLDRLGGGDGRQLSVA
eukprot:9467735-Pyramimonas_sp.AAC.1